MELMEIEKELSGPNRDAALAEYDDVLVALGTRLKSALDRGLPPGEYEKCRELAEAAFVARKLLRLQVRDGNG